jgi:hypothetical protein
MPPIEVFVGMDAIRSSAEHVPGLPTREELQKWLVEHDAIEKETEIFDSGELKTIKKFTKGPSAGTRSMVQYIHAIPPKLLRNEIYPPRTLT